MKRRGRKGTLSNRWEVLASSGDRLEIDAHRIARALVAEYSRGDVAEDRVMLRSVLHGLAEILPLELEIMIREAGEIAMLLALLQSEAASNVKLTAGPRILTDEVLRYRRKLLTQFFTLLGAGKKRRHYTWDGPASERFAEEVELVLPFWKKAAAFYARNGSSADFRRDPSLSRMLEEIGGETPHKLLVELRKRQPGDLRTTPVALACQHAQARGALSLITLPDENRTPDRLTLRNLYHRATKARTGNGVRR